jgi:hypothetical protein
LGNREIIIIFINMYEFINKKNVFKIIQKIRHIIFFYAAYPLGFVFLIAAVLYAFLINKIGVENLLSTVMIIFLASALIFVNLLGACNKYEKFGKKYLKAVEKVGELFVLGGFAAYLFFIISAFILRGAGSAEILDYFNSGASYWISVVLLLCFAFIPLFILSLLFFVVMLNKNKWLGYIAIFIIWLSFNYFSPLTLSFVYWIAQHEFVYKYIFGISGLFIFLNFFQIKYGENMVKKFRY